MRMGELGDNSPSTFQLPSCLLYRLTPIEFDLLRAVSLRVNFHMVAHFVFCGHVLTSTSSWIYHISLALMTGSTVCRVPFPGETPYEPRKLADI